MTYSEKINSVNTIILDVDGVLTDGILGYNGNEVIKFFNTKDGHAIKTALNAGYKVGILTGRSDNATRKRAEELNLSFLYEGKINKAIAFEQILTDNNLTAKECLYIGDDVIDIPVLRKAGIGACVADAADEVKKCSDWQSTLAGGKGAVREIIVRLLNEKGQWENAMQPYLTEEENEKL